MIKEINSKANFYSKHLYERVNNCVIKFKLLELFVNAKKYFFYILPVWSKLSTKKLSIYLKIHQHLLRDEIQYILNAFCILSGIIPSRERCATLQIVLKVNIRVWSYYLCYLRVTESSISRCVNFSEEVVLNYNSH